jgi:hypothetical protein
VKESKIQQSIIADWAVVQQLCKSAKLEPSEENVGMRTLDNFNYLLAPQLKFIMPRDPLLTQLSKIAHLKHPRGKRSMDDAINGVDNCISVAFRVRNKKSRLLAMKELNNMETETLTQSMRISPLGCWK